MIAFISPAKNMKPSQAFTAPTSLPIFIKDAISLNSQLKTYSPWDLMNLFKINEKLADDSFDRLQNMRFDLSGTSALETYSGIQYKYIDPISFKNSHKSFAQQHIRILSAMYGILRPYDSICEYRLEMASKFKPDSCHSLYDYWSDRICRQIITSGEPLVNLASAEYSKTITRHLPDHIPLITITFKSHHKGKLLVQATNAKMARGKMIRYIVQNQLTNPEDLKNFEFNGYQFIKSLSYNNEYVFIQNL